jgi:osmotically inducible lipoprotein OsmB
MWKSTILLPAAATALLLAGCGTSTVDRTGSGAGIGAGTGAVIGALAGGVGAPVGAAIGAGVGGATGAVTKPSTVDLGTPLWERTGENQSGSAARQNTMASTTTSAPSAPPSRRGQETSSAAASSVPSQVGEGTIKAVQTELQTAGLYKGRVDGIMGPKTRDAIKQYQTQAGLQQSGRLDQPTLAKLIDVGQGTQNAMNPQQGNGGTPAGTGANNSPGASNRSNGSNSGKNPNGS